MIEPVQLLSVAVSGGLLLLVLELVRRRRLSEEFSLAWIAGALALLVLSLWRRLLDTVAVALGIYYPPALLLLALVLLVFLGLLYFSVVVSTLRRRIDRLSEEVALLDAEVRRERGSEPADPHP